MQSQVIGEFKRNILGTYRAPGLRFAAH